MTSSGVAAAASAASALPEAAFPHADDRLAALVRIMPAVVYSVSPSGNFISGQSSWHAFTGRSFPESADTGWLQAYHEDDRPKLFARFAAATLPAPSDPGYSHARLWSVKHSEHRRMLCRSFLIRDPTTHLPRCVACHLPSWERTRDSSKRSNAITNQLDLLHAPACITSLSPDCWQGVAQR